MSLANLSSACVAVAEVPRRYGAPRSLRDNGIHVIDRFVKVGKYRSAGSAAITASPTGSPNWDYTSLKGLSRKMVSFAM